MNNSQNGRDGRYIPGGNPQRNNHRQYNGQDYKNRRPNAGKQYYTAPGSNGSDPDSQIKRLMIIMAAVVALIAVFYISCTMCESCGCGSCGEKEPPAPVETHQPEEPQIATVRVTFPEGYNVRQMGARLEENGVCSASDFYDTMNSVDFSAEYDFLPSFAELSGRDYYLEGYLFPDTYDFFVGESSQSVIKRFLNNFDVKIGDDLRQAAKTTGEFYGVETDLDDIIIMASIVEREINVPDEMDGVAAVFWNRIKYPGGTVNGSATGGFFQSDATKYYPYVFNVDTLPEGFVSDYNTFNVKGLPKGPICCPSFEAIKGSIYPDHDEDAFFFYTDINKKVYYAVTLSEHQKNWKYCVDNGLNPW